MKNEASLNTIIKNSFNILIPNSRLFKIPDPMHGTGIQNPFDIFGSINSKPSYIESKLFKSEFGAFNLSRIEDHQYDNLHFYYSTIKDSYCLYCIGYYIPRKIKGLFIFDSELIFNLKLNGLTSIKQKQLKSLNEFFIPINYHTINESRLELVSLNHDFDKKIIKDL